MQMDDPRAYLPPVRALAAQAGQRIVEIYEQDFSVAHKDDGSPVTLADHAANEIITAGLGALAPDLPILSEESSTIEYAERAHWRRFWLVDPLDGTREFVGRNGEFTVNIALIDAGRPVLGVVYVPLMRLCFYACVGGGALKQKADAEPVAIHVRSYKGKHPIVAASRSHSDANLDNYLARLGW